MSTTHEENRGQGRLVVLGCIIVAVLIMLPLAVVAIPFIMIAGLLGGGRSDSEFQGCPTADGVVGSTSAGGVRVPVVGTYTATSDFGMRLHPVLGVYKLHDGLDLAMIPTGGTIVAMQGGKVRTSVTEWGGNMVDIDHGNGLRSRYLHMAEFKVRDGATVRAGDALGVEGSTGYVTGNHLHWSVFRNDQVIDPRIWAKEQGIELPAVGAQTKAPAAGAAPEAAPGTSGPPAQGDAAPAAVGPWKGEQLTNAAEIIAAGRALGLDDWSIAVGVAVAMGESSLKNIDRGDAVGPDSRGLFQQRANGAWGSEGDRMTPRIAATNFFKALRKVKGYRQMAPTMAGHKAQANADPYHYEPFWEQAVEVVSVITKNPGLMASMDANGAAAACATDDGPAAGGEGEPAAPSVPCPPSRSSGEKGLNEPAMTMLRCGAVGFPKIKTMYGLGDRAGDHPAGNAVDFMIEDYRSPEGRAYGWQLAHWARKHADKLGVKYIIFDMKIWSVARNDEGWRKYDRYGDTEDDTLAHRDHVHVSTYSAFGATGER